MANADVLDILSDTLTPTNRASANKDEIIREKVMIFFFSSPRSMKSFIFDFRKKVRRKVFVDRKE
jgi:hypothetical protein